MCAKVYFDQKSKTAVGVRFDGILLPVVSGKPLTVTAGDTTVTTVNLTMFAEGCEFIYLASEEVEALASEASASRGGAK